MTRVYANLLGVWTDLSSDPDCVIGNNRQSPSTWWEEGADMWYPKDQTEENTLYQWPYVMLSYKGTTYRVFPSQIQILGE